MRFWSVFKKKRENKSAPFNSVGDHVTFFDDLRVVGRENVFVGSHVFIGHGCSFYCGIAPLKIGCHVMLGPEVMIITGDHRIDVPGVYMDEVLDDMKLPNNDLPVIIEDDCWICARALILKGVRIGKGSVIAAGATVLKNVPPYSVYYSKNDIRPRFRNRAGGQKD